MPQESQITISSDRGAIASNSVRGWKLIILAILNLLSIFFYATPLQWLILFLRLPPITLLNAELFGRYLPWYVTLALIIAIILAIACVFFWYKSFKFGFIFQTLLVVPSVFLVIFWLEIREFLHSPINSWTLSEIFSASPFIPLTLSIAVLFALICVVAIRKIRK